MSVLIVAFDPGKGARDGLRRGLGGSGVRASGCVGDGGVVMNAAGGGRGEYEHHGHRFLKLLWRYSTACQVLAVRRMSVPGLRDAAGRLDRGGEMVSSGRMIVNSACTLLFDNRTKN